MRVVRTTALPQHPDAGQDIVRLVRHQMADILHALGEPVGPHPGEVIHSFRSGDTLFVSPDMYDRILEGMADCPT